MENVLNMVEEKTMPLHELKYYYGEHLGFVFQGVVPSSNDAIQRLCNNLVSWKVTKKLPEFYVRVPDNSIAFIFSNDSEFRQGLFYQACNRLSVMGIFKIDTLSAWLKEH